MLGILCGLESEAALARRIDGAAVACAAARPQKARWLARELVKKGATRLLSFGIAGALEPGLPIGSLVIGTEVASTDGKWDCENAWANELSRKLPEAHCGGVWGSEVIVPTAREKDTLYRKSRCLIVDMESQAAAQVAKESGLPFGVLRAVCDTSVMEVPPIVMAAIAADGHIDYLRALMNIVRHPAQVPALFHMMRGTGRALKVLKLSLNALTA